MRVRPTHDEMARVILGLETKLGNAENQVAELKMHLHGHKLALEWLEEKYNAVGGQVIEQTERAERAEAEVRDMLKALEQAYDDAGNAHDTLARVREAIEPYVDGDHSVLADVVLKALEGGEDA